MYWPLKHNLSTQGIGGRESTLKATFMYPTSILEKYPPSIISSFPVFYRSHHHHAWGNPLVTQKSSIFTFKKTDFLQKHHFPHFCVVWNSFGVHDVFSIFQREGIFFVIWMTVQRYPNRSYYGRLELGSTSCTCSVWGRDIFLRSKTVQQYSDWSMIDHLITLSRKSETNDRRKKSL